MLQQIVKTKINPAKTVERLQRGQSTTIKSAYLRRVNVQASLTSSPEVAPALGGKPQ